MVSTTAWTYKRSLKSPYNHSGRNYNLNSNVHIKWTYVYLRSECYKAGHALRKQAIWEPPTYLRQTKEYGVVISLFLFSCPSLVFSCFAGLCVCSDFVHCVVLALHRLVSVMNSGRYNGSQAGTTELVNL